MSYGSRAFREMDWLAQSICFSRPEWNPSKACRWLEERGYHPLVVYESIDELCYWLRSPDPFVRFRTKKIGYEVHLKFGAAA